MKCSNILCVVLVAFVASSQAGFLDGLSKLIDKVEGLTLFGNDGDSFETTESPIAKTITAIKLLLTEPQQTLANIDIEFETNLKANSDKMIDNLVSKVPLLKPFKPVLEQTMNALLTTIDITVNATTDTIAKSLTKSQTDNNNFLNLISNCMLEYPVDGSTLNPLLMAQDCVTDQVSALKSNIQELGDDLTKVGAAYASDIGVLTDCLVEGGVMKINKCNSKTNKAFSKTTKTELQKISGSTQKILRPITGKDQTMQKCVKKQLDLMSGSLTKGEKALKQCIEDNA